MECHNAVKNAGLSVSSSPDLFKDFHNLQSVWTHPSMFAMKKIAENMKNDTDENDDTDDSDDNDEDANDPKDDEYSTSDEEENMVVEISE